MNEQIISLTEFKASASRLLKKIDEPKQFILTQNGTATAVVQDYEQYKKQQQSLLMLKLMVQGESDIQQDELIPQEEVFSTLRTDLLSRQKIKEAI